LEKNPAGTLGPLIDLYINQALMDCPFIFANGDSLMDIDLYSTYLQGTTLALQNKLDLDYLVIISATLIPWELSGNYGALEFDPDNPIVTGFKEKIQIDDLMIQFKFQFLTSCQSGCIQMILLFDFGNYQSWVSVRSNSLSN
jgi:hypothetical protein